MSQPKSLQEALPSLWRIVRYAWPAIRRQRALIIGSFLALFAEIGLRLLEPWPLKFIFDRAIVSSHHGRSPGISALDGVDPLTLVSLAALAVVTITALRAVAAYWNTVGFALIGNRVLVEMRDVLYRHLQGLSLSFHNKGRSGELAVRVVNDVALLQDATVTALLPLLGRCLIVIGMLTVMCWLQLELALFALAMVPLFWLSTGYLGRRIREVSRRQRQREGAMAATATESIGAIKVVQALSLEQTFAQAFAAHNQKSLKQGVQAKRLEANLERSVDVLIAIGTALVLWRGGWLVLRHALSPGDLLVFLAYLKNAFKPVQDFAKYVGRLAKAAAAGERVLDVLEQTPDVQDLPGAVRAPAFRGGVRFSGVSFDYEPGQSVLENIDFEVHPGQHVALVGSSGIGKSTLVSLLLRLYDPLRGQVMIDGRDIREYTLESLRAQISVVLQDSILFAASVRDNIAFGAADASGDKIEVAARLGNAHEFIVALPQGYDTTIGERGVTVSTGQRQRIAIARAAIRQAPILVLDEPTTGLDEENERSVIEALERLAQGRTTFLITHNLQLASRFDLIISLEGGRVRERGTHAELIRANGRYASLYRLQAGIDNGDVNDKGCNAVTV